MGIFRKILPLILAAISVAAVFYYYNNQPSLDYDKCEKCDAHQYLRMYQKFDTGESQQVYFPFHNRILLPFVLAQLPGENAVQKFFLLSAVCCVLFVLFYAFILQKIGIETAPVVLFSLWTVFHFSGIVRTGMYDRATIDAATLFFQLLLIYVLYYEKYSWLIWMGPIGTLQKESFLAFEIILLFFVLALYVLNSRDKISLYQVGMAILFSLAVKLFSNNFIVEYKTHQNEARTLLVHLYLTITNPIRILQYIVGLYLAYGAIWFVAVLKLRNYTPKSNFEFIMLLFTVSSFMFGMLAGYDTTRILMLGLPFVFISVYYLLKEVNTRGWLLLLLLSIPAMHLFHAIPVNYKEYGTDFTIFFSEKAGIKHLLIWLSLSVFCYFAAWYALFKTDYFTTKNHRLA